MAELEQLQALTLQVQQLTGAMVDMGTGSHVYTDHSFQITSMREITKPFSLE